MHKLFTLLLIQSLFLTTIFAQNIEKSNYEESDSVLINPERGFSLYRGSPINMGIINEIKAEKVSIIQRIYTIPQFTNSLLSDDFLTVVESDFNVARDGGIKLVPRFSYTNDIDGKDAPLDIMLGQIEQLKPLFHKHSDIIAYLEAGFIGAWGEWYYSSNGLNNSTGRRAVLFALHDALPVDRSVVVRTPSYKREIFDDDLPLDFEEGFSGSNKARTGAHNDCFLANVSDYGTYNNVEEDKSYLNLDNRFVPQGGETCNPSTYAECVNALVDLERMHYSILNKDYHGEVLSGWENNGCMDEVKKRLGYRLVLLDGEYSSKIKPGGIFTAKINLANYGFASPYNKRNFDLILREKSSLEQYRLNTDVDPRYWFAGDSVSISISAGIESNMPEGDYELLLHLADPSEKLYSRPEYSIQLANNNVWEELTGFNLICTNIEISNSADGESFTGDKFFVKDKAVIIPTKSMEIDGEFDDWNSVPQFDLNKDEENSGDGLNANVDIEDLWVAADDDAIYFSYRLSGEFGSDYFYHVFLDVDADPTTGYHMGGSYAGVDLMVENDLLWKYTGTNGEWGWEQYNVVLASTGVKDKNRIELSLSKLALSALGLGDKIDFVIHVNNLDDNVADDYAPNNYNERSYTYNFFTTSVASESQLTPEEFKLSAYPNPFNGQVNLVYNSNGKTLLNGAIYDVLGRKVKSFTREQLNLENLIWLGLNDTGDDVGTGLYLFKIETNAGIYSTKLMLLK